MAPKIGTFGQPIDSSGRKKATREKLCYNKTMSMIELFILGLALSMDAFAVTVSNAFVYRGTDRPHRLLMPVFFGVFQGLMPVIGFYAGSLVGSFIETYAGIITFIILGFIGGKMLWDAFHEEPEEVFDKQAKLTIPVLFFQAIATSIDALAVGVSFAALSLDITLAATLIGLTTALCCLAALIIGRHFGMKLGNKATIIGGIVLIAIGIKALFT